MAQSRVPVKRKQIAVTVNGKKREAEVDARMTLAEFLRGELDLTGTKVGCNRGECGSCTVILDGKAVYSCTMLAFEADGRDVQTIESLADGEKLHPLQEAFIEQDALQCGYCTPGMIMSVKALLDRTLQPTEEEVRIALDGNLCRCGCFPAIIRAALDAAARIASQGGAK